MNRTFRPLLILVKKVNICPYIHFLDFMRETGHADAHGPRTFLNLFR